MKYFFEYLIFLLISRIVFLFGIEKVKYPAKVIARIFFYLIPIRKKVVMKNLKIAFPELPLKQISEIALKTYISSAVTFLEIIALEKASENEIRSIMRVENEQLLKNKFAENKGLILLTAHFGNWELGAIIMKLVIGNPLIVLSKKQKNKYVTEWMKKIRERFGNSEIYLGISVRELFTALKNKNIVGIVGDQRAPQTSIKINFFNQKTPFFSGFTNLALKLNTPIIAAFAIRQNDFKYKVELHEIVFSENSEINDANIRLLLQQYADLLQAKIIAHPEQWFWMHNIWKYNR